MNKNEPTHAISADIAFYRSAATSHDRFRHVCDIWDRPYALSLLRKS